MQFVERHSRHSGGTSSRRQIIGEMARKLSWRSIVQTPTQRRDRPLRPASCGSSSHNRGLSPDSHSWVLIRCAHDPPSRRAPPSSRAKMRPGSTVSTVPSINCSPRLTALFMENRQADLALMHPDYITGGFPALYKRRGERVRLRPGRALGSRLNHVHHVKIAAM